MNNPTEIFAERLAVQTRQHDATDPRLIACHFTAGWLAAVDALNVKGLTQDLAPAAPQPDADGWFVHNPGDPMPCAPELSVQIRFRDGSASYTTAPASQWRWSSKGHEGDIIAWRPAV